MFNHSTTASTSTSQRGADFNNHDYDEQDVRRRYAQLCDSMRPANLKIPSSLPDSDRSSIGGIALIEIKHSKKEEERSSSSDSTDSNDSASLLLRVTSLQFPSSNVIPPGRTRTPRTPRTPAACQSNNGRRRTCSPSDELRLLGRYETASPSEFLIHRYKAMTPKSSDFSI